ncbi:MAG: nucleotidyltransferase family protein [Chlamydiia bacterium]|nr:nucleotidyltransferase family protein [Chlamydiia bacterium]
MEALLLVGGLGTRLALPNLPKALAPIQQIPFLKILLDQLTHWQVSKIVLAIGHRAQAIVDYVNSLHLPIEYSWETAPLGTGGALLNALSKIRAETFLVMNGDSFFDLPLAPFLELHRTHSAVATIACHHIEDISRYGSLELEETGRIRCFQEKRGESKPGWINAGIYLMQKKALEAFPLRSCSLEKDIFPTLIPQGVFAYRHSATFIDIGTPQSLQDAQNVLKSLVV